MSERQCIPVAQDEATGRFVSHHCTDHDFFKTWTPEMAWVLGYTCADGTISSAIRIGYSCITEDVGILESIREVMATSHPIGVRKPQPNRYGKKPMSRLDINSRKMVSDLATLHGILPRKTYGNPGIPQVPDELLGHFFRGVFDGDGCFHCRPIKTFQAVVHLVGTERFLSELADRMHAVYGLTRSPVFFAKHIHAIQWTGKTATQTIYNAMYPAGVRHFCKRKREAFGAAMSSMPATHCRVDSKTGFRGVRSNRDAYTAWFLSGGAKVYLGRYATALEAAVAHNLYAATKNTPPAKLNPIPESTPQAVRASAETKLRRLNLLSG